MLTKINLVIEKINSVFVSLGIKNARVRYTNYACFTRERDHIRFNPNRL